MNFKRRFVLWGALVAVIGATINVYRQEESVNEGIVQTRISDRSTLNPGSDNEMPRVVLERLNHRKVGATDIDPFRAKAWFTPPPVIAPAPPPKPTAPALPFQYAGKSEDADGGGNVVVYLSKGNESFAVKAGEKFDNVYQFEGIENGNLVFQYLPLSEKQMLSIGQ